ncbi:MAG TPA: energy-coupling factor ABC transporter ATP-binding protein [Anaerovoracaceae bacterium]|nr:energy-coupling factor ABC transporter ATP-binding protein [Anaerovoracaceae bacterium]
MITIDNVSFGYAHEKDTLKNINFHIMPGECVLLCGKSGCGKTTVTKLVNGLIPHFIENGRLAGTVTAAGMEVAHTELYELSKRIGSVFQNPKSQFFNLDSDAELAFGLENVGAPPEYMRERLKATVEELKIERLTHRGIFTMSGGERQALAFGSVHAMNPDIYVLDEPSANLDGGAVEILRRQLGKIKRQGKTILIAEHRLYFLTDLIDRAVYMKDGEIVHIYTREEFLALSDGQRIEMGLRTLWADAFQAANSPRQKVGSIFAIQDLCCEIKDSRIFDHVSFHAGSGEIVGITGNNGIGKSTLMRCICGLVKEKGGSVSLDGRLLTQKQRNKECFCVMQDVNHQLFSDSVWNECALSVVSDREAEIEAVLRVFDLLGYKDAHPMALSGGQKQRLAIACGVLSGKRILVFDEPTSGLDYEHMTAVAGKIRKLAEDERIILIVTHDVEFLHYVCDRTVTLTLNNSGKEAGSTC